MNKTSIPKRLRRQRIIVYALVIGLIVMVMFPFFWLLHMSVKPDQDIMSFPHFDSGLT